jgi:hypothetical protein
MTTVEATEYLGSQHVDWIMWHGKADALKICAERRRQHEQAGHADDAVAYEAISKFIEEFGSDEPKLIAVVG